MMKAATVRCSNPSCRLLWDTQFEDSRYYVECPDCHQMAVIPNDARKITGRCGKCGVPLDDHPRKECKP